MEKLKTK